MNIAQGRGLGLAPFVEQQMLRHSGLEGTKPAGGGRQAGDYLANPVPSARTPDAADAMGQRQDVVGASPSGPSGAVSTPGGKGLVWDSPETFVRDIWPMAKRTAQSLGVSPRALVAQAALETGWGQHVIRRPDGSSSNNLFNIKAHAGWNGDSVGVPTLEYRDGVAVRETAQFRAYDSLQQAFDDYGSFLRAHPRYSGALEAGEDAPQFLRGLQRAGYATDPGYAEKIERILGSDVFSSLESPLKNSGDGTTT
jgi:flagellar protein FlgJ